MTIFIIITFSQVEPSGGGGGAGGDHHCGGRGVGGNGVKKRSI